MVTSKFVLAASMKSLDVSMIVRRFGPVPWKAVPSSRTVVRRLFLFTDSVVVLMSDSSFVVGIGVTVMSDGISEPSWR